MVTLKGVNRSRPLGTVPNTGMVDDHTLDPPRSQFVKGAVTRRLGIPHVTVNEVHT
jgi:hypothetical protein